MLQPLILLGGFIKIPFYVYYWVHSSAQIDLLAVDAPLTVYKSDKKDGEHTKKEMNELMKKWQEKREKEGKAADFKVGTKVNLNDFLRTGIDAFNNTKTK